MLRQFCELNKEFKLLLSAGHFVCCHLVDMDIKENSLHLINADMPPAFAGSQVLESTEPPLGVMPVSPRHNDITVHQLSLAQGCWMYTDGLSDIVDINPAWFDSHGGQKASLENDLMPDATGCAE